MVDTWSTYASAVPCRLDMARGGVKSTSSDILSQRTHIVYMDYRSDIIWKNKRIQIGTEVFEVVLVSDAGGESDHLEISVEIVE
jgi:head-tail adaptor